MTDSDISTRRDCIALLFDHVRPGTSLDQYAESLTWWEIDPILVAGNLAGCVMACRHEIHIVVRPEYWGTWFKREYVGWLRARIADHGLIVTKVHSGNIRCQKFMEKLGFKRIDENENEITYSMDNPISL